MAEKLKFNTWTQKRKQKPEKQGGESKTETAGYISNSQRIKQFIRAGEHLQQARSNQFDFEDNKIDLEQEMLDITRVRGIDLVDVMATRKLIFRKIRDKQKEAKEALLKDERKKQKAILLEEINKELDKKENMTPDNTPEEAPAE